MGIMGKELRSDKILLDFGGDIGKKTVDQVISSHNILFDQRNELLEMLKHLLSLKHAKDMDGRTPYYLEEMPKAWGKAKYLITKIEKK